MFEIVDELIDERAVVQSVEDPRAGAICTFAGVVRDNSRGKRVLYLEYEAYAEMAVRQMQKIAAEMKTRWDILHVSMVHRTGRLETLCLMAGLDLPARVIREQIASAIDLVIQQARLSDGSRKITYITEVSGMEEDVIVLQDIFKYQESGRDARGGVLGEIRPTGLRPRFTPRLEQNGFKLPPEIFGVEEFGPRRR